MFKIFKGGIRGMMKRAIILLCCVFIAVNICLSEGISDKINIGLWAGMGGVSMSGPNGLINDITDPTGSKTEMTRSMLFGLEGGYLYNEKILIGLKIGYVNINEGKGNDTFVFGSDITQFENKFTASLIPIFIGAKYIHPLNEKLNLTFGLFPGIGITTAKFTSVFNYTISGTPGSISFETPMQSASVFGYNITIGADYRIKPSISIGLDLQYLSLSTDLKSDKGTVYKDFVSGNPRKLDYSGASVLLNVKYYFGTPKI